MTTPDLTSFQRYVLTRWTVDHSEWAEAFSVVPGECGGSDLVFRACSPAQASNVLVVVLSPDEILVSFGLPDEHEHYDPMLYGTSDAAGPLDAWDQAYADAVHGHVRRVLDDALHVVRYDGGGAVVPDARAFAEMNGIRTIRVESWSQPAVSINLRSLG